MKIKYLGPSSTVNVAPYGKHDVGEDKDYPNEFGEALIKTSRKQKFIKVGGAKEGKGNDKNNQEG